MALVYRNSGAWGVGKGGPLTIAEADGNNYHHDQRIQNLIDNPPDANNVQSITQDGALIYFNMDNGDVHGPFTLPTAPPRATGVQAVAGATHTPTVANANTYFRCTNATACAVTIPLNSTQAFPTGTELHYCQAAAGPVSVAGAVGVTINKRADRNAATDTQGAVFTLKKVDVNVWDLFGDLAVP